MTCGESECQQVVRYLGGFMPQLKKDRISVQVTRSNWSKKHGYEGLIIYKKKVDNTLIQKL